jgi:hypothetical protein
MQRQSVRRRHLRLAREASAAGEASVHAAVAREVTTLAAAGTKRQRVRGNKAYLISPCMRDPVQNDFYFSTGGVVNTIGCS